MRRTTTLVISLLVPAGFVLAQVADKPPRSEAEKQASAKVLQQGGLVMDIAQNDPRLEVSYQQRDKKLTDDCLLPLKDLKGLIHLNLRGQDMTDARLAYLKDLTSLTRLHLELTPITDQGLANLKGLVNLEYLNLYGTGISDAGLVHLEGMKKLKNLYLWQTKVTDAGVARLKKALPNVDIDRGLDVKPVEVKKVEIKQEESKKD